MRTCFFILFFSRLFFPPQFLILLNAVTGRGYLTFMACDWYLLLLIFSLIFIVQNVMNSLFLVWFVAGGAPSSLRIAFVFFSRAFERFEVFSQCLFSHFSPSFLGMRLSDSLATQTRKVMMVTLVINLSKSLVSITVSDKNTLVLIFLSFAAEEPKSF